MKPIILGISMLLNIYVWILIISIIYSWLLVFNVINTRNQFVAMLGDFLYRITEPALRPIRNMLYRFLPDLGGIDVSPIILFVLIYVVQIYLIEYILPIVP